MKTRSHLPRAATIAVLLMTGLAGTLRAQLIQLRSAPIALSDQFDVFPAVNLGMGGATIAHRDSLRDPFANPALGSRSGSLVWVAPAVYSVSHDAGAGRTLPLGAMLHAGGWFAGIAGVVQQVDPSRPPNPGDVVFAPADAVPPFGGPFFQTPEISRTPRNNSYGFLMLGRRAGRVAVGASATWANLTGVEGVDVMYTGASAIAQRGRTLDLRLGLAGEWRGQTVQAVLLRHRFDMTHDVTWQDAAWDPGTQSFIPVPRLERNADRTNTWGAHLGFDRALSLGWRAGAVATVNRMDHPRLPDYDLATIPRDPGRTWAYNFGVGVARRNGPASFALDALYEPVRTHTASGATDSRFQFRNMHLRVGVGRDFVVEGVGRVAGVQLGLQLKSVDYSLTQRDIAASTARSVREHWVEWSPTWGFSFRFPEVELRYRGRATSGTGRPASFFSPPILERALSVGPALLAPAGGLTLQDVSVVTHQISLSLPLR